MFVISRIKNLPGPLIFMIMVFLVTPFISLVYLPSPIGLFQKFALIEAILLLLTYWIVPVILVGTMIGQSFTALILLILQAFLLIVTAILNLEMLVSDAKIIRILSILVMTVAGWVILSQDLLFPFLTDGHRFWRRHKRIHGNRLMTLLGANQDRYKVMLNDVSLSGMGITVPKEAELYLSESKPGDELEFEIRERELSCIIKTNLVWKKSLGPVVQVGVMASDKELMEKVQKTVKYLAKTSRWQTAINHLWARAHFRQFVYGMWILSVIATFALPYFSLQFSEKPPEAQFHQEQNL